MEVPIPADPAPGAEAADARRAAPPRPDQLDRFAGDPNFMLSLARGLYVLEAFSERKRPLTISQIAQRTTLSRASVRRCLYTLQQLGYVSQEDGRYALRPRVLHLGHAYFSSAALVAQAQPILDRLSQALGHTSALAILEDTDILYLARSEVQRMLPHALGMGSRLPAFCTSVGRLLLSQLDDDAREAYFARAELRPRTLQTKVSREELEESFARARELDYVVVDEELEPGLRAIAVPVRAPSGEAVAGISVSVRPGRVDQAEIATRLLPKMRQAADDIGACIAAG
ncbi:IclR family transcriptional regulator [Cupriavidus gilardii J11]|uniref:IclR family transcriptional regulator n=1 Tax=Cupriavidus gilardii J11 TaxID=936133 RepID=A0A562BPK6_9BURK|nr:IclR family transcriptional regulator C-terminal domain-containing protein [Cupriavidus gilardii]TWG87215.1 IclR family transcriptional regulator [Cupriavidus gilardii J11]